MPKATVNTTDTERFELKTCQGGYIELRRMSYGQVVQRRALMKLEFVSQGKGKDVQGEMAMASEKITRFEFDHCIVDHNLEDEAGRKLNLSAPVDFAKLDPRIGQEIEDLIGKMNNFEDEEGNS